MVDVGKGLILYSDLTNPQVINSELKSYPRSTCGKSFGRHSVFYKNEKMPTGKIPYIQSTVNPSSGGNHVNVCSQDFNNKLIIPIIREFIMQRNLKNVRVWQILQVAFRPKKTSGDPCSRGLPKIINVARLFVYTSGFLSIFTLGKNCINVISVSGF